MAQTTTLGAQMSSREPTSFQLSGSSVQLAHVTFTSFSGCLLNHVAHLRILFGGMPAQQLYVNVNMSVC